ncbi:MAG: hypothetical protein KGY39_06930 [Anaerolineales bacterium]|nr:hypothetical protein [Anaerolineales bacterium]
MSRGNGLFTFRPEVEALITLETYILLRYRCVSPCGGAGLFGASRFPFSHRKPDDRAGIPAARKAILEVDGRAN